MRYIKFFDEVRLKDVNEVGGKNGSLGEMIHALVPKGVMIPNGFATTAAAYWHFIDSNGIRDQIDQLLNAIILGDMRVLQKHAQAIRLLIQHGTMPVDLKQEIQSAYDQLSKHYGGEPCDVAVRSSATAEDLPQASFAGQQESYLHVVGHEMLIARIIDCMASLFTDRAIAYRIQKGFDHNKVALSVGVQKMIRSDRAVSGVAFSLDTESGFKDVVLIEAAYGLGEAVVKGIVIPDEYMMFKPTFKEGFSPIIKKELGAKKEKIVYQQDGGTIMVETTTEERNQYCLTDAQIEQLAKQVMLIEDYYSQLNGCWSPMDVEWAQDADDGNLYIVQARPETVYSHTEPSVLTTEYNMKTTEQPILKGLSIGKTIVVGTVKLIHSIHEVSTVEPHDVIVTEMTDPDWVSLMKQAAGIITDHGGRTCHAAIVSRELGIPAVVGTRDATRLLRDGQSVTIDCSRSETGFVFDGVIPFEKQVIKLDTLPKISVLLEINIGDPEGALRASQLPVDGVGLARIEFIISSAVKIHPMALISPEKVTDKKVLEHIELSMRGYADKKRYFVHKLARGVAMIVAAFYPRSVIVRLSDFKSNEYRGLIGGQFFEPVEENPMIGLRGASRYYNPLYQPAFELECAAMKHVIDDMGLINMQLMVPFVRTVAEAKKVLAVMAECGLTRGYKGLKIIMMCEIPSSVLLIDQYATLFDGFSIGSNDLTQMTLGVDRDSGLLASLFNEQNEAVVQLIAQAIQGAHRHKLPIGICGQAPSDYPGFADFLLEQGIDSISLSPDAVIPFLLRKAAESKNK